ncbi:MAG: hypothetical protein ACR2H1_12765, partial [Limisphaerales bacterium]
MKTFYNSNVSVGFSSHYRMKEFSHRLSLEPTAARLSGLARLPFRAAGSSGCGSAFIRYAAFCTSHMKMLFTSMNRTEVGMLRSVIAAAGIEFEVRHAAPNANYPTGPFYP